MCIDFISLFKNEMKKLNIEVLGLLDKQDIIHPLGFDTKIVGRVFEIMTQPILEKIASDNNLVLEPTEKQTVYPDFVMRAPDGKEKIAIDVKTSYLKKKDADILFTLGSYGSYMRNNKKNIVGAYTDYTKHFVIGFIYERNINGNHGTCFSYKDKEQMSSPYINAKWFVQEKYKIAGDKPGSGNTENIGSIKSNNLSDFENGKGPFSILGDKAFDLYWRNYPKYKERKNDKNNDTNSNVKFKDLAGFMSWFLRQKKQPFSYLEYDFDALKARIKEFKKRKKEIK